MVAIESTVSVRHGIPVFRSDAGTSEVAFSQVLTHEGRAIPRLRCLFSGPSLPARGPWFLPIISDVEHQPVQCHGDVPLPKLSQTSSSMTAYFLYNIPVPPLTLNTRMVRCQAADNNSQPYTAFTLGMQDVSSDKLS